MRYENNDMGGWNLWILNAHSINNSVLKCWILKDNLEQSKHFHDLNWSFDRIWLNLNAPKFDKCTKLQIYSRKDEK